MLDLGKECQGALSIGITGHTNPDGDCIGTTLALWQFLKKLKPECRIDVILEKPAPEYDFIQGIDQIITDDTKPFTYDVMIVVDSVPERCGHANTYVLRAKKLINIDHHISNPGCGDAYYVDPKASSAAEVLYDLIASRQEYLDLIDKELAQTIYVGIIHDSGVMQYSNTSPKTLRIVADLISYGFDFPKLIEETFYERTYIQSQITGRAVLEAFPMLDGKCMVSMVDRKTMDFYGAEKKDLSGIVNELRNIKGVEVAIFIYEVGTQEYKISMRSRSYIDVAKVAVFFGGVGHFRAAGCNMNGNFYDIVNNLMEQIVLQMEALHIETGCIDV